jgi:hypothetical protein
MSMRAWAAGVFAVGAIGYAGTHKGDDPPADRPVFHSDIQNWPTLDDIPKPAGMSDREWCRSNIQRWSTYGTVPDDWRCQGKPMSFWRGQQ